MTKLFTHNVFKHFSKTLISLISILQAVKSAIKNTWKIPVRIRKFTDRTSTNQNAGLLNI